MELIDKMYRWRFEECCQIRDVLYLTDFSPIGYVECAQRYRYEAARQASIAPDNEAWMQFNEGQALQQGLAGLAEFERIWVLCELHLNETWRALV